MARIINRDPFARADFIREAIPMRDRRPCTWCGARPGRFLYGWHRDGIYTRPELNPRPFCSVDCYRSYTEELKP